MILTRDHIVREINDGRIVVDPFTAEDHIGPASIDLHLGNIFRRFKKSAGTIVAREETDMEKITDTIEIARGGAITLKPGEFALGVTWEKITLPDDIAGWIEGRSRFARIGIGVHITSGFIQPGTSNHQVLEIVNSGTKPVKLAPGLRICQVVFERCEGRAEYRGEYRNQIGP